MSARDIFDIYRTRFQLEFVFYEKPFISRSAMPNSSQGSHTVRQGNKEALSFSFNASLTSVNLARTFARQQDMDLSVGSPKPCCTTLQWWVDLLQCPENLRICDLITLISKNFYSTAFEPWRNFYKTNELLYMEYANICGLEVTIRWIIFCLI